MESSPVAVTIDKANPVTRWPDASELTYGDALGSSKLTGGEAVEGSFAWGDEVRDETPAVADSGGHFTSEVWEAVMRGETALTSSSSGSGYGLRNVERRLCLFFETSRVMELDCSDPGETRIVIPFFSKVPEQTPDGSTA